jgi:hypothetical protein
MTNANIQSYVKNTEILVIKKCDSEVCQNSFLQCKFHVIFTLALSIFLPRYKLQLSFTFRLCWVVRCALLSSTFHPVHAEKSGSRTSILRFHVAETEDCHLQEPRVGACGYLSITIPYMEGKQEKAADITW